MKNDFPFRVQKPLRLAACAIVLASGLGFSTAFAQGAGAAAETIPGATARSLIDHARLTNPGFAAARAEADAARERVSPAGALPDPRFELELMDATNTMSGRSASLLPGQVGETRYRIVQPLPGWGKRDLAVKAAQAQVGQAEAMRDAAWVELAARIEALRLRYHAADRERGLARDALELLQGLEELGLARYELGLLPQQAVLRMQREITAQRLELVDIEQRRLGLAAGLNGLLGRRWRRRPILIRCPRAWRGPRCSRRWRAPTPRCRSQSGASTSPAPSVSAPTRTACPTSRWA